MKPNETTEPVLVLNPLTGRYVNVLPLFKLLQSFADGYAGEKPVARRLSQINRLLNVSTREPETDQGEAIRAAQDLYDLEDMFGALAEIKQ